MQKIIEHSLERIISADALENISSGIYLLEIYAAKDFQIMLKKFSAVHFKNGFYYYVGSAQRNLHHRILRHIKKNKKPHWHIDHLTNNSCTRISKVFIIDSAAKPAETELASSLSSRLKLDDSITGFGNSDTSKSKTHLFYSKDPIDYSQLFSLYQSMVCFIPSSNPTF